MARILIDSGFWLGFCDTQDQWHNQAKVIAKEIDVHQFLVPWPTLYETLSTRFVKKQHQVDLFMLELQRVKHEKIDDAKYRDIALSEIVHNVRQRRNLSLVDSVLRQMLADDSLHIKAIVTFNPRDFSVICYKQGIGLYPDSV